MGKAMKQFIKDNRQELDKIIKKRQGFCQYPRLNDTDRHEWIMNDEGLYNWARSEGVRV